MPGCQFPSPGDLPTQGLNPGLLNCRWILYQLSHQGSPRILAWVAVVFSSESSFASSSCFLPCRPSCCWMTWLLPWTHRAALTRPVFTHRGHQTWRGRWNTLNCMCCSAIWLQSWRTEVRGAHQWVGNLGGGLRGHGPLFLECSAGSLLACGQLDVSSRSSALCSETCRDRSLTRTSIREGLPEVRVSHGHSLSHTRSHTVN